MPRGNHKTGAERYPHGKILVSYIKSNGKKLVIPRPVPCPVGCTLHVQSRNKLYQQRFKLRQVQGVPEDNTIVQHGVVKLCNLCNMPGHQHISWRHCVASLKQQVDALRWKIGGKLA